jgi:hypothetical protein
MQPAVNNSMDSLTFKQKIKNLISIHPVHETVTCLPVVKDCMICQKPVMDPRLSCFGTFRNNTMTLTHKCVNCNRVLYTRKSKKKPGTWDPDYAKTRKNKPVIEPDPDSSAK